MSDTNPLDGPPEDGLDEAFKLPPSIADSPAMTQLHGEIVLRLRREASGLSMNTVQQLLLERIATFYVQTKMREMEGVGVKELRELNSFWLSMTQEFNRLLMASQDKLREALFLEIQKILDQAMKDTITDPDTRKKFRLNVAGSFANMNL